MRGQPQGSGWEKSAKKIVQKPEAKMVLKNNHKQEKKKRGAGETGQGRKVMVRKGEPR